MRAVHLHAERVDGEDERLAAVAEGAEEELHVVVGVDAIAIGQRGPHAVGRGAAARTPKCMAVGEYHTSTSVARSAAPPSTGA